MTYIKNHLFIGIWMWAFLFFAKEGQCFTEDAEENEEFRPSTALRRKTGSTFRAQSKKKFMEELRATDARVEARRKEALVIEGLWKSAFTTPTEFQKIIIHLIGEDLRSEKGAFRLSVIPGENPLFEFFYQKKEDGASSNEVLIRIEFISDLERFFKREKEVFAKQKNSYMFSRILRRPLKNLQNYSTLKLLLNALDAVSISCPLGLSWYGIRKEEGRRTVLTTSEEANKALKITYFKNVLNPEDYVSREEISLEPLSLRGGDQKKGKPPLLEEELDEYMQTPGAAAADDDNDSSSSDGREYLDVGD